MKSLQVFLLSVLSLLLASPSVADLPARSLLLPYYRQSTCGVNCLYAVCLLKHVDVRLKDVCQATGGDDRGTSMLSLLSAARDLGLDPRPLKTKLKTLEKTDGWAIAYLTRGHYVLCVGWRGDKLVIVDPPRSAYLMTKKEFSRQWSGYVLLFDRSAAKNTRRSGIIIPPAREQWLGNHAPASCLSLDAILRQDRWMLQASAS